MGGLPDWLLSPWSWLIAAALLAGLEMLTPGAFMIWLAGAAVVTALLALLLPIGWQIQIVLFVALSVVAIVTARKYFGRRPDRAPESGLNRRAERLVGTTVVVVEAFVHGKGRVQVGDSPWAATGPNLAVGDAAKVVHVDGATLKVEAV
ncbi:NfeD family protein [Polymorphobacter arshaanensis]|uniref:NfeD family protein n=1 Tax=Glacieibacterium arshaanense TaxID=2511025 RepID=A0A4Y9EMV2_9SPHN|nr:NfeD family protein [Polymorphobacter arshaanensis]TFU03030.1 NfeD family protein [Polymorphobacter arshaanensis]